MDRKWVLLAFAIALIASIAYPSGKLSLPASGLEQTVRFDLDLDDGGLIHGGTNDPWEWGVPGEGTPESPGPGGAKGGAWGAPLNGTYPNGTDAFLDLPEVDTSLLSSLSMSFLVWYDLPTSGDMTDVDELALMVRTTSRDWEVALRLRGSSNGSWSEQELSLDQYIGSSLNIRFRLTDRADGQQGRGPIIDEIVLNGEAEGPVPVHFSRPLSHPIFMSAFDIAHFSFFLAGGPPSSLGDANVRVVVSAEDDRTLLDRTIAVTDAMMGTNTISWTPDIVGQYWVDVVLFGPGTESSEQFFTAVAVDAIQYDDMDRGTSPYTVTNITGNVSWYSLASAQGCLSLSRGRTLKAGGGASASQGFLGPAHAVLESDWYDLRDLRTATLSLVHALESTGPALTCGAVFELVSGDGTWTVAPLKGMDPSYLALGPGTGPLAGRTGFTGPYDWKETVFDLTSHAGERTKLRVSFVSGSEGSGAGLFIDDILLWGDQAESDTTPPSKVTGLKHTVPSDGRVLLSWDASEAEDLGTYRIYVGEGGFRGLDGLSPELEVPSYEISALITGLDPKKVHWAAVTAVDLSGNEDRAVEPISFTPAIIGMNRPPVAVIDAQYGTQRRLGEDFIFDGARSYDPDNDPITYVWTLPDGSTDRGVRTRWRSSSVGEGLVVRLTVTDSKGASSNETVVIEVLPEEGGIIQTGDLLQFLICLLPLFMALILLIALLILLRRRRNERLRDMLREVGIEVVGPKEASAATSRPKEIPRAPHPAPRVVDLVPAKAPIKPPTTVHPRKASPSKRTTPGGTHAPHRKPSSTEPRADPLKLEPPEPPSVSERSRDTVKVSLECPYCGAVFKERVDKEAMKKGALENVVCPHCGRKGDIIG